MRLVLSGGGTGGHVYPALEVARLARDRGHEILYLGSQRGQEAGVCQREGILFHGFPSQPLYSLKSPSGWKAAAALLQARMQARTALRAARPDVLFSTGGYSAGPVVSAARALKIPYMLHEGNSAPGRSNLLFAKEAFCCMLSSAWASVGKLQNA
jgi:UDP-N-acetylglucosamine--N-acetylmuramyl-(pentapeptide) pyrophosphoryl-undecaprenol N-acetylglucosamine transferase